MYSSQLRATCHAADTRGAKPMMQRHRATRRENALCEADHGYTNNATCEDAVCHNANYEIKSAGLERKT